MRLQKVLTNFPHLEIIPLSTAIASDAARLRADHGIRTPDAIHLATAIDHGAAGFITNDIKLQRLQDELPIWLIGG
jgi:predicted nucleic acid-binding protein